MKASSINQKDDFDADLQIARPLVPPQPELQAPLHEERVGTKDGEKRKSTRGQEQQLQRDLILV